MEKSSSDIFHFNHTLGNNAKSKLEEKSNSNSQGQNRNSHNFSTASSFSNHKGKGIEHWTGDQGRMTTGHQNTGNKHHNSPPTSTSADLLSSSHEQPLQSTHTKQKRTSPSSSHADSYKNSISNRDIKKRPASMRRVAPPPLSTRNKRGHSASVGDLLSIVPEKHSHNDSGAAVEKSQTKKVKKWIFKDTTHLFTKQHTNASTAGGKGRKHSRTSSVELVRDCDEAVLSPGASSEHSSLMQDDTSSVETAHSECSYGTAAFTIGGASSTSQTAHCLSPMEVIATTPMSPACQPSSQKSDSHPSTNIVSPTFQHKQETRAYSIDIAHTSVISPEENCIATPPLGSAPPSVNAHTHQFNQYLRNFMYSDKKSKWSSYLSVFELNAPQSDSTSQNDRSLVPHRGSPTQEDKLLIIDMFYMVRAFCSEDLQRFIVSKWRHILNMCCQIEDVDYLSLFIVEFGRNFEEMTIPSHVRLTLLSRIMNHIDESQHQEGTNSHTAAELLRDSFSGISQQEGSCSMIWMSVLAVQVLCLNFVHQESESKETLEEITDLSERPQDDSHSSSPDSSKDDSSETSSSKSTSDNGNAAVPFDLFFTSNILKHKNYNIFYHHLLEDFVNHLQDDSGEFNYYRLRFLRLFFADGCTLCTTVFYSSDFECILQTLVGTIGVLAECENSQDLFEEASATLLSIIESKPYKTAFNQVLSKNIESMMSHLITKDRCFCDENALRMAKKILEAIRD